MTAKAAFNTDEWNLLRGIVPFVSTGVAAFGKGDLEDLIGVVTPT